MKTILSGVQTWTKGKIKESTADWNQNDPNADSYVKNRTHWEEVQKKLLVSNEKIANYWGAQLNNSIQLEEDATYIINVNGVRYELTAQYNEYWDWICAGNRLYIDGVDDGSGVPFVFDGGWINAPFGEYTVSVSTLIDGVETEVIEEQTVYIMWFRSLGENTLHPGNVYRVKFDDDTYEFTAVENADASAVIIGDMLQYPCEVWCYDGWLELYSMVPGYHYIDIVDVTNDSQIVSECLIGEYGWWSIDDGIKLPKLQEGESYTITWNGAQYTCIGKNFYDGIYIGNNVYLYLDGSTDNPVDTKEPFVFGYYPMDDFAFVCLNPNQVATYSVAENKTVVHKLDSKYLDLDLSLKMDRNNPVGTGSFSMNRLDDSEIGEYSHAEGMDIVASGIYSHAEGWGTTASGHSSHAEGQYTTASGAYSHAEGAETTASEYSSHAEGGSTTASGAYSHAEGCLSSTDANATARTVNSSTLGYASHAEGYGTVAKGAVSHAEGNGTTASGSNSHAEGWNTVASGTSSHAEGSSTIASGSFSHAEGSSTTASGDYSHAEGNVTKAYGNHSHTSGLGTVAYGESKFVTGEYNEYGYEILDSDSSLYITFKISNTYYFSDKYQLDIKTGKVTLVSPREVLGQDIASQLDEMRGCYMIAPRSGQALQTGPTGYRMIRIDQDTYVTEPNYQGTCSLYGSRTIEISNAPNFRGTYVHIVGNGTSDTARSNAHTLAWDGTAWYAGDIYVGSTSGTNMDDGSKKLATEDFVLNHSTEGEAITLDEIDEICSLEI